MSFKTKGGNLLIQNQETKTGPINNWLEVNEKLHRYKITTAIAGGVALLLFFYSIYLSVRAPLVVAFNDGEAIFEIASRKDVVIDEKVIEKYLRQFICLLYEWNSLDPKATIKAISPFVTDGLSTRILQTLTLRKEKDFKDKTISQGVTNIDVKFSDNSIVAKFDKVLRVNGIPLVVPTEIGFTLSKGSSTKWNPTGLYVNGMIEHEGSQN